MTTEAQVVGTIDDAGAQALAEVYALLIAAARERRARQQAPAGEPQPEIDRAAEETHSREQDNAVPELTA